MSVSPKAVILSFLVQQVSYFYEDYKTSVSNVAVKQWNKQLKHLVNYNKILYLEMGELRKYLVKINRMLSLYTSFTMFNSKSSLLNLIGLHFQ